jgi:hypothetical protein
MIASGLNARPPPASIMAPLTGPIAGPIVGIDVGEDFLDLAALDAAGKALRLARVAVTGIDRGGLANDGGARAVGNADDGGATRELEQRLLAAAPELAAKGTIVLIDSPRWPRDFNPAMNAADAHANARASASRKIDITLRAIVRELALKKPDGAPFRLALFPTPKLEFFAACALDPRCKPHLAAIARELFGRALESAPALPAPAGGRVFTRFMLTGFAVYRALERTPAASFEGYPDLAFRLWARGVQITPKGAGRPALDARKDINRRLAKEIGCTGTGNISTLDQADAAVLALCAGLATRTGVIVLIGHPGEGRLALALDRAQNRRSLIKASIKWLDPS